MSKAYAGVTLETGVTILLDPRPAHPGAAARHGRRAAIVCQQADNPLVFMADIELVDVSNFPAQPEPTSASVSYVLAHETSRELEVRGEFCRAAELLAIALAEEAQRDNQRALQALDLTTHAESFKAITIAMASQRQLSRSLLVPLLDERVPALLGGCLQAIIAHRLPRQPLPRPHLALSAIAKRWHLPISQVADEYWPDFVRASGGAFTLSLARARQTILEGASDEVALATWRFVLTDPAAAELIVFGGDDEDDLADHGEPSVRVRSTSMLYAKTVNMTHETPAEAAAPEAAAPDGAAPDGAAADGAPPPDGPLEALQTAFDSAMTAVVDVASGGASDAEAHGNGCDSVGGGGGLSLEEYVVLRRFVEAETLEAQVLPLLSPPRPCSRPLAPALAPSPPRPCSRAHALACATETAVPIPVAAPR